MTNTIISTILQHEPRKKIWLYFLDLRIRFALAVLFFGLLFAETSFGKLLLLAGLGWMLGALVLDRFRPSDRELDALLSHEVEQVTEKARRSHEPQGDEMRAAPLALLGPVEHDPFVGQSVFTRPRTGQDGGRRSPINRVVVLMPLGDRLGIYSCHHNALVDQTSRVAAEEHYYRDVASVILERDSEAEQEGNSRPEDRHATQVFSVELNNGRRLSFPVSSAGAVGGGGEGAAAGLARTVHAIQTLLRDHR